MKHVIKEKRKTLTRVKRIRGQIDAVATAIENDEHCYDILLTVSSIRGALSGLMVELIENHLMNHVVDGQTQLSPSQVTAARELMAALHSFVK